MLKRKNDTIGINSFNELSDRKPVIRYTSVLASVPAHSLASSKAKS